MALQQLLGKRDHITDNAGKPLSAGLVNLYEPNTLNRIQSYSDSALTVSNTNPVVLSGAGRANIWISRNCDVRITDRDGNLIVEELGANPDDLGGEFDSGLVPNGSFESDEDADSVPDGWTNDVNDPGSNNGLDTGESTSGGQSWRTLSAGSGGGELVTTNFFPVNETDDLRVNFDLRATVAAVRNIVRVEWYDVSQVAISNSDVYDSTNNPSSFESQVTLAAPPAGARFAKIRIIGGATGGQQAGITYWDRFNVFYPLVVPGVFDNVTIRDNEIITTNTNGDLDIEPNGSGELNLNSPVNVAGELIASDRIVAAYNADVDLSDDDATLLVRVGSGQHLELDGDQIQSKSDETTTGLLSLNTLGGDVRVGAQSGSGGVHLYHDGAVLLAAANAGAVNLRSVGNTDSEARRLRFLYQDATNRGHVGFDTSDVLELASAVHGGVLRIIGEEAGGTARTLAEFDPAGNVRLYSGASETLSVAAGGNVVLRSVGNTDSETRQMSFRHQDGTARGAVGFSGDDILRLRNNVHGGHLILGAETAGGSVVTLFEGDPDGAADLRFAGTQAIVTQDRTANGTVTGARVQDRGGTLRDVGLAVMDRTSESTDIDLSEARWHKCIIHSNAGDHTFTLIDLPEVANGAVLWVQNIGSGGLTLAEGAGVTVRLWDGASSPVSNSGNLEIAVGGWVTIHKASDTIYDVVGVGATLAP